jgi:CRISPR-associated endonuclease/helicase Cas3
MKDDDYIAHVCKNEDGSWASPQLLSEHLYGTAQLAKAYAGKFQSEKWGEAAGLAHDAGKGRLIWQNYLRKKSGFFDEEAHLELLDHKKIYSERLRRMTYGTISISS